MTVEEIKNLNYEQALRLIRFTPVGSPLFIHGTGLHAALAERWAYLEGITPQEERIAISKKIGWET